MPSPELEETLREHDAPAPAASPAAPNLTPTPEANHSTMAGLGPDFDVPVLELLDGRKYDLLPLPGVKLSTGVQLFLTSHPILIAAARSKQGPDGELVDLDDLAKNLLQVGITPKTLHEAGKAAKLLRAARIAENVQTALDAQTPEIPLTEEQAQAAREEVEQATTAALASLDEAPDYDEPNGDWAEYVLFGMFSNLDPMILQTPLDLAWMQIQRYSKREQATLPERGEFDTLMSLEMIVHAMRCFFRRNVGVMRRFTRR